MEPGLLESEKEEGKDAKPLSLTQGRFYKDSLEDMTTEPCESQEEYLQVRLSPAIYQQASQQESFENLAQVVMTMPHNSMTLGHIQDVSSMMAFF